MSVTLRKILTSNIENLVRSAFSEDLDLLRTFNGNVSVALDIAAADLLSSIQPGDMFFTIENQHAAYVGFFTFGSAQATMSFHLRNSFRTSDYIQAFWNLVNETLNNKFYTSIGSTNLISLPGILISTFTIKNQSEYHGKNFVLLKEII